MTSTSLIQYEAWTDDDVKDAREEIDDLTAGEFAKIPVGRSVFRVLPSRLGEGAPIKHTMEHFIKPTGGVKTVRFVCPRHMAKRGCPACSQADKLRSSGHPLDYKEAGSFLARLRAYMNIINRGSPGRGPQVLAVSKTLYNDIMALRDEHGDLTNPADGFDIIIHRKGTKMEDTEYKVTAARENTPLSEDATEANSWIAAQKDLRQYTRVATEDELAEMGVVGPRTSDGGGRRAAAPRDEPRPAPKGTERGARPSAKPKPEPRPRTIEDDAMDVDDGVVVEGELVSDDDDDGFDM